MNIALCGAKSPVPNEIEMYKTGTPQEETKEEEEIEDILAADLDESVIHDIEDYDTIGQDIERKQKQTLSSKTILARRHKALKEILDYQYSDVVQYICNITDLVTFRYCPECKEIKPPRSHHCAICGKCYLRFDHHCTMAGSCIGFNNCKIFI